MEAFNGERRLAAPSGAFPEEVTPFPQTDGLFYDHTPVLIPPPGSDHRPHFALQKLRPVRCNGRNVPDYSHHVPNGIIVDNLLHPERIIGSSSSQLGFLRQLPSPSPSSSAVFPGVSPEILENGGTGGHIPGSSITVEFKSEMMEAENMISDLKRQISEFEYSSSSSDDTGDSPEDANAPRMLKRKRTMKKILEEFLENLMMQMVNKQEQMHKQLIEMIEKKETERLIREEAWKKQELERAKQEEEIRAQEASRSIALISFIQSALGHDMEIPYPVQSSCLEEDDSETQSPGNFKSDSNNRRWPKSEVQALITLRTALAHKFCNLGTKTPLWEEISAGLANMGYSRSAKKCKEKWENINKYFKKSMENQRKQPLTAKVCPYFQELEILHRNGLIGWEKTSNSAKNEDKGENGKE
ncbi:hypothetical protein Ancab_033352 [Ancistrocladus abbreviatus]